MTPEQVDAALVKLARGRGVLDLAIGEALRELFKGKRLMEVGFSLHKDYARERLGVPVRTMYYWMELAAALEDRPLLRRAVASGLLNPRKAMTVAPLALGKAEAPLTAAAIHERLPELERMVRETGKMPAPESFVVDNLWIRMTEEQQHRFDNGLRMAAFLIGFDSPRWQRMEVLCMEWLGSSGGFGPDAGPAAIPEVEASEPEPVRNFEDWTREWAEVAGALEEHIACLEIAASTATERPASRPSARELDARLFRLVRARRSFDAPFGRLLAFASKHRLWRRLKYRTFEEYCRDRLGIAPRTLRERVWLERRMTVLPELREALDDGRLTYSKALIVARNATPEDVADWIADGSKTTWQQLERDSTEREDRRNLARGERRLWGPQDVMELLSQAILSVQCYAASKGQRIGVGEALAVMADHFVATWAEWQKRRKVPKRREEVLMRFGGLCAVPTCSRRAEHVHHIKFKSRGGSDRLPNKLGTCGHHHLGGIHAGYLRVTGRAGEELIWEVGTGEVMPLEVWVTRQDGRSEKVA